MWLCMSDGMLSAVQHKENADMLIVRARNPQHLDNFSPNHLVEVSSSSDYISRISLSKDEFSQVLTRRIAGIDYKNFKKSVGERMLHQLYLEFWCCHRAYQERVNPPFPLSDVSER